MWRVNPTEQSEIYFWVNMARVVLAALDKSFDSFGVPYPYKVEYVHEQEKWYL